MLTRRILAAGLGLSFIGQGALARQTTPAPAPPAAAPDPVVLLDASLDADDRLTVPAMINGQGPFKFVVDTGADRCVLSASLAASLNLPRGADILVHGISGSTLAPSAIVDTLTVGDARLERATLPVLTDDRVGADGLLGVDILDGRNVVMDFHRRQIEVRRSLSILDAHQWSREVVVRTGEKFGRLTIVDCRVAGCRALGLVDSGGGVSIGNMALSRAIATRRRDDDPRPIQLLTAAGEVSLGQFRTASSLVLGDVRISNLPMAFADVHVFDVLDLSAKPAVLLAVDILRMFSRVELDFGAGRMVFRLGAAADLRSMTA